METDLIARLYESFLWRRNPFLVFLLGSTFNKEYKLTSRALRLTGTETILDLACGPGIYTRRLAREVQHGLVFGLDLSWPMLKHGKRLARRAGSTNLHLIRGNARVMPFANNRFDVVNCAAALHLFGELRRTFAEVHRVLKPGGRFTFSTFRFPKNRAMRLFVHLRQNLLGIRSFRQEDLEKELQRTGFEEIQYLYSRGIWLVISARKSLPGL